MGVDPGHMMQPAVLTLVQDAALWVRCLPGSGDRLVLVFTGIRHALGGMPMDEYIGTASGAGRNHVLFVSDMTRSWYSQPGLVSRIRAVVDDYCGRNGIRRLVTLGNSMGGYGALLMCHHLPVDRALAMSPQISLHPARITEPRWPQFRARLGPDLAASAVDGFGALPTRAVVLYGLDDPADAAQMALIPSLGNIALRGLAGTGHNLAQRIKDAGLHRPLFQAVLDDDIATLDRLCAAIAAQAADQGPAHYPVDRDAPDAV